MNLLMNSRQAHVVLQRADLCVAECGGCQAPSQRENGPVDRVQSGLRSAMKRSIVSPTVRLALASRLVRRRARRAPSGSRPSQFVASQHPASRAASTLTSDRSPSGSPCQEVHPPSGSGDLYSKDKRAVRLPMTSADPGTRPSRSVTEGLSPGQPGGWLHRCSGGDRPARHESCPFCGKSAESGAV